jgi:uncharacterized protein (TIGR02391 family)
MQKPPLPCFKIAQIEALCKILADTSSGLTGTEIAHFLGQAGIKDIDPTNTKWKRLYNALAQRQYQDQSGDRILAFIALTLAPARYAGNRDTFERRRTEVNVLLAFQGFEFKGDGKFHRVNQAATLGEAEHRAHRLRAAMSARGVHQEVLRFCRAELLNNNCFHAVLEATKGVAERLRGLTGATNDGAELVDEALGGSAPKIKINQFITDSEKSEQRGFTNLLKGLFGTFRNPTAHAPRIAWQLKEDDALDLFSLCSYVHRRLDGSHT